MLDDPLFAIFRNIRMDEYPDSGQANSASRLNPSGLKNPDSFQEFNVFYLLNHFSQST